MAKLLNAALAITALAVCSNAYSMSCAEFNAAGLAGNAQQVLSTNATQTQINHFKDVAADTAAKMARNRFSKRGSAYHSVRERNTVTTFMQAALVISREDCFNTPSKSAESVIIESIYLLIDAVAAELNKVE